MEAVVYAVAGLALLAYIISRQVGERRRTRRSLVLLPAGFLVLALTVDHTAAHRLAHPLAVAMLVAGVLVAAGFGVVRATTMVVRRDGDTLVTKGTRRTLVLWLLTIAVRVGMAVLAYALGAPEGAAEGLLFAAATIGAQNLVLARRGGLLRTAVPAFQ